VRSLSHVDFLAMRRFPALDGLRAVAAVMVVAFHMGGAAWSWLSGWIGVHVFFVLSGFLITTLGLREEDRFGRVSVRDFYVRRVFRILPVYFVVLGTYMVVYLLRHEFTSSGLRDNLPYYLTFTNEFEKRVVAPFGHSWTMGVEQKYYLVWPVLAFALGVVSLQRRLVITLAVIAGLALTMVPPWGAGSAWALAYLPLPIGSLLAIVMHDPRGFTLVRWLTRPVVGTVYALVFIAAHVSIYFVSPHLESQLDRKGTAVIVINVYAVLVALLIPALLSATPVRWLLTRRSMVFIGERSYSLYLVQSLGYFVAVGLVPALAPQRTLTFVVTTVVSLCIADVLYRYVEQPMMGIGRRIVHRRREPSVGAPPPMRDPEPVG
jgi:peptidoglycan/LPS O-acetylase OafA/YrhL